MSLNEIGMQENVENRTNSEYVMIQQNEGEKRNILSENCEIIRLNNDLITINQSQIKKIVKDVLKSDDPERIRQQYSELCIQYKDIWIKVRYKIYSNGVSTNLIRYYDIINSLIFKQFFSCTIEVGRICTRRRFIAIQREAPLYASALLDDPNWKEMFESVRVSLVTFAISIDIIKTTNISLY